VASSTRAVEYEVTPTPESRRAHSLTAPQSVTQLVFRNEQSTFQNGYPARPQQESGSTNTHHQATGEHSFVFQLWGAHEAVDRERTSRVILSANQIPAVASAARSLALRSSVSANL